MEFTKGEWKVVTDKEYHTHIMAFGGDKPSEEGMERNICLLSKRAVEEEDANAHLIASSPDLYEACKEAEGILDYHAGEFTLVAKARDILTEAIAKVEK